MVNYASLCSNFDAFIGETKDTLKSQLETLYIQKGLSIGRIAEIAKGEASEGTIRKLLIQYGIKLRPRGGKHERVTTNAT
jgi:hypothetical protein